MSRTVRRNHLNKKNRVFHHYWNDYSIEEAKNKEFLAFWKYQSDNYYTKSSYKRKQFTKNIMDRKVRRESTVKLINAIRNNDLEVVFHQPEKLCINWMIH